MGPRSLFNSTTSILYFVYLPDSQWQIHLRPSSDGDSAPQVSAVSDSPPTPVYAGGNFSHFSTGCHRCQCIMFSASIFCWFKIPSVLEALC
uniref:Uncharacterized protein n=1 Tax=Utricularia reniformis TaxID=192314 RepID=A0A1Y0AYQ6_9LAMI|nr:hypothetical protein AEK19_MT0407 [Utricularia reniformis]ART30280.1 hypothetical protein AEK19_MT0407 [Utricularia reniformis]